MGAQCLDFPHTPFLCSRTVAAFLGLNRDRALHTPRQDPTRGARGILPLQNQLPGGGRGGLHKTTPPFRSVPSPKRNVSRIQSVTWSRLHARTGGQARNATETFLSARRHFASVGPTFISVGCFPRPSVTRLKLRSGSGGGDNKRSSITAAKQWNICARRCVAHICALAYVFCTISWRVRARARV